MRKPGPGEEHADNDFALAGRSYDPVQSDCPDTSLGSPNPFESQRDTGRAGRTEPSIAEGSQRVGQFSCILCGRANARLRCLRRDR